jgi:hypothetical protein
MMHARGLLTSALAGAFVWGASGSALAIEPATPVTRRQGEIAFSKAVIFSCLTRQERRISIADLPSEYRDDLVLANPNDIIRLGGKQSNGPVWISRTLGSHLRVEEISPTRCGVFADQLPVAETLEKTQQVAQTLRPPFSPVEVKPGYNPVVYEVERMVNGARIKIHMEGAEPGFPGHDSRFSILWAIVAN